MIFGDNQFRSKYTSSTQSVSKTVSIGLTTLAHMLNGYDICFNTANYQFSLFQVSDIDCISVVYF